MRPTPVFLLFAAALSAADPLPPGALARCGTATLRHPGIHGEDNGFAFRPDGKAVASVGGQTVRLWDVADGRKVWEFAAKTEVRTAHFSADGKRLAVCTNASVLLVDSATGKLEHTVKAGMAAVAFAPDGRTLATTRDGWGEPVTLWDAATGEKTGELPVEKHGKPQALGFSADGNGLSAALWGTRDGSAIVWVASWDTATRTRRPDFDPNARMHVYRLSPDGRRLAVRPSAYDHIAVWDVETGKSLGSIGLGHLQFDFADDGKTLVTCAPSHGRGPTQVALWDVASGKKVRELTLPGEMAEAVRLSSDGKFVATAKRGEMLCLWDAATGERRLGGTAHDHQVTGLAFALGGKTLISGSGNDVRTWDAATGARIGSLPAGTREPAVLPGGRELVANAGGWRRIDIATGKPVGEPLSLPTLPGALPGDTFVWWKAAGSPDGTTVVSWGYVRGPARKNSDPHMVVWDGRSGKVAAAYALPSSPGEALSADGRVAARGRTTVHPNPVEKEREYFPSEHLTEIEAFDSLTGRVLSVYRVPPEFRFHLDLSADGQTICLLSSKHGAVPAHPPVSLDVRLVEARSGKERRAIPLKSPDHYDPAHTTLSTNGRLIAVSRLSNRIEVFDTATGRELVVLSGFESSAYTLAFRADGRRLATGHTDGTILVWDVPAPPALPRADPDAAWADLASEDAGKADAASWALATSPGGLKLLSERLKPADGSIVDRVKKLVADLDSPTFAVREAASRDLARLVEIADPLLQEAARGKLSDEQSTRLRWVLEPPSTVRSTELLRTLRGIETLERIGTPDAAAVLKKFADGPAGLRPTTEARAAVARMAALR